MLELCHWLAVSPVLAIWGDFWNLFWNPPRSLGKSGLVTHCFKLLHAMSLSQILHGGAYNCLHIIVKTYCWFSGPWSSSCHPISWENTSLILICSSCWQFHMCFLHAWQVSLYKISVPPYLSGILTSWLKKQKLPSEREHLGSVESAWRLWEFLALRNFKSNPSTNHLTSSSTTVSSTPRWHSWISTFRFSPASVSFVLSQNVYQWVLFISTGRDGRWSKSTIIQMRKQAHRRQMSYQEVST